MNTQMTAATRLIPAISEASAHKKEGCTCFFVIRFLVTICVPHGPSPDLLYPPSAGPFVHTGPRFVAYITRL